MFKHHTPLPASIEKRLCEILGLSEIETNILYRIRKNPLPLSTICQLINSPRTSVGDAIRRLHDRKLLTQIGVEHKNIRWYSNMPVIFREIRAMKLPDRTAWMKSDGFDENV